MSSSHDVVSPLSSSANRRYRLVVFDWDGTLMDSVAGIVACVQAGVSELGWQRFNDRTVADVIGLDWLEACKLLYPQRPMSDYQLLKEATQRHYKLLTTTPVRTFPGARAVLETLSRRGYLIAVATGKSRAGLQRELLQSGLARWVDVSRCAEETASKPDPLMLREILDELAVDPLQSVVVGDSEYDLAMASALGVDAIGVSYGVHGTQRLAQHQPIACIDDIRQLPSLLLAQGQQPGEGAGE